MLKIRAANVYNFVHIALKL